MYWALGTTSVHEPPKEPGEDHVDSLLGLDRSRSGTYLATITKSVLHIWHLDVWMHMLALRNFCKLTRRISH